jgi:hypothetical protein
VLKSCLRGRSWLLFGLLAVGLAATNIALYVIALDVPASSSKHIPPPQVDVSVSTDRSSPLGQSQFSPGITHVDESLDYPSGNNSLAAIQKVSPLLRKSVTYQNTPIMGWGLPDPWPDPSASEPSDWSALDARLRLVEGTGGIPVLTLCEAPWWMKGQLQPDGATLALSRADEWSTRAYSSRILDDKMDAWLLLVQRVAERYMAPPYSVRYFQVWNELKGYYDPVTNVYDFTTSAGHPNEPDATHGYTYLYNRVYDRLMSVADGLGIARGDVKVGGPYVVMDTWSSANQSNPSAITKPYGTFDQRPLDVVMYWLRHKTDAGFISVDVDTSNKDGVDISFASVASEKFADVVRWIRSLDVARYPGAATLPIWLAEWYANPQTDWTNHVHSNAIKTYAMMEFLKAGGAVALAWGGSAQGRSGPGLWTDTVAGGGKALPFYSSYRDFKQYFAPGTQLYRTTAAPIGLVDAVASASEVMLVNMTSKTVVASVDGTIMSLAPYQVTTTRTSP